MKFMEEAEVASFFGEKYHKASGYNIIKKTFKTSLNIKHLYSQVKKNGV